VLVTGELRFPDAASVVRFVRTFPPEADFYIATYRQMEHLANCIVRLSKTIDDDGQLHATAIRSDDGSMAEDRTSIVDAKDLDVAGVYPNLRQWAHLDRLIFSFGERLRSGYDVIFKARSELQYFRSDGIVAGDFIHVQPGHFYARSDQAFYAEASTFLDVMGDFYAAATLRYFDHNDAYFAINYTSFAASDRNALMVSRMMMGRGE
jgi:hypothetical protein